MAIKESSDELNPTVVAPTGILPVRRARTVGDYVALAIATCGVGYIPIAPGTFGSLVGLGVWAMVRICVVTVLWPLAARKELDLLDIVYGVIAAEVIVIILITLAGTWAATRVEKLHGAKDPQKVVIDEVAGQFIALSVVVPLIFGNWWTIIVAFVLFRFFDIVKPYPAGKLENLHGGLGIMADDVVAGIYAAIGVAVAITVHSFI